MLHRLKECHAQLEALADSIDAFYASSETPDFDSFAMVRWEVANLSMRHMSMVDRFILAHLASDERPEVRATVEQFRFRCTERIRAFAAHAKLWPADRVERDWDGFRRAGALQLSALRAALVDIKELIFPLACPVRSWEPKGLSRNWASEGFAIKQNVVPQRTSRPAMPAKPGPR